MNFESIKKIYFIGIGGIGMSGLARYFHRHGAAVHGYDRSETELTRTLSSEGMQIHYEDDIRYIPEGVDLVVYTPAVPQDHRELNWFLDRGYPVKKRAEVLGIISRAKRCIAIAGTHGKTTTSSMTAHLLRACGIDATAFVGGIALNLGGNYAEGSSDWVVVEADEYDRSFLHLHPEIAVINSVDPDHLDIYGTAEAVQESYKQFASQLKPGGRLFLHLDVPFDIPAAQFFGIGKAQYEAANLRVEDGQMVFDLFINDPILIANTGQDLPFVLQGLRLNYPGRHNVSNATAAIAAALATGATPEAIRKALPEFRGVKRRFEYIVRQPNLVYVDDYAHHPAELEAAIGAARILYPGKKLTGIFQPHLYTRTRDFADGFAAALDQLDEVLLLDIYPARELPIPGVSSDTIANLMKNKNIEIVTKENILNILKNKQIEVLMTMGAGDIDTLIEPIKELLLSNFG